MIVFGEGCYGKVDLVPGLFYVVTEFVHVFWFPLIPKASYLIMDRSDQQALRIPLQWRSVLAGWLRGALIGAGIVLAVNALDALIKGPRVGRSISMLLAASLCFGLFAYTLRFTRARPRRALQLASLVDIAPETVAQHFVGHPDLDKLIEELTHGQETSVDR